MNEKITEKRLVAVQRAVRLERSGLRRPTNAMRHERKAISVWRKGQGRYGEKPCSMMREE